MAELGGNMSDVTTFASGKGTACDFCMNSTGEKSKNNEMGISAPDSGLMNVAAQVVKNLTNSI